MRRLLLLTLLHFYLNCNSQPTPIIVDLNRIPQPKIRTLISDSPVEGTITSCSVPEPTFRVGQSLEGYRYLESEYLLHEKPEIVWNSYQSANPAISWNGSMISFGLLISNTGSMIFYKDDLHYAGIDTGQVFYVNLRIMKGLYNLAVGLAIVDINQDRKSITYSYIKGGKSQGEQTIYFIPTRQGNTRILHQTAFKGDSFIRDRYLYPWFHRRAINEFHRNMKRSIIKQT
jgi:hypothetical protein